MNTLELLIAARKKIERPECWTKGWEARDKDGRATDACDPVATCWCGIGAIWYCAAEFTSETSYSENALHVACGEHFPSWQDAVERTHAEVLACFDRAIETERQKAAAASSRTGDAA